MNQSNSLIDDGSLPTPLEKAIQIIILEPIPSDSVERVIQKSSDIEKHSYVINSTMRVTKSGTSILGRSVIRGVGISLAILIIVFGSVFLLDRSSGAAFSQVIERVNAAQSVSFSMTTGSGKLMEMASQVTINGNIWRLEQTDPGHVQIIDFGLKKAVYLDTDRKVVQLSDTEDQISLKNINPISQILNVKPKSAREIGMEIIEGRGTKIYRVANVDFLGIKGIGELLIWVDSEKDLPAKIVIQDPNSGGRGKIKFEKLVWNQPIESHLFSLEIPEGFQRGIVLTPQYNPNPVPGENKQTIHAMENGIFQYRVPEHVIWGPGGSTITAIFRDPDFFSQSKCKPPELMQLNIETGKPNWIEPLSGATFMAGTRDGKLIATSTGSEIHIRDPQTGKIQKKWRSSWPVSPIAFSPDGKFLAGGITEWRKPDPSPGKSKGGFQIWDISKSVLYKNVLDDRQTTMIKFSNDGKYLATSSVNGPIKLWDTNNWEFIRSIEGCSGFDFSPDGKNIACILIAPHKGRGIGQIVLYQVQEGTLVKTLSTGKSSEPSFLRSISYSPNSRLIVASDWNGTLSIWDVASGSTKFKIPGVKAGVHCISFGAESNKLVFGSEDRNLRVIQLSGELPLGPGKSNP